MIENENKNIFSWQQIIVAISYNLIKKVFFLIFFLVNFWISVSSLRLMKKSEIGVWSVKVIFIYKFKRSKLYFYYFKLLDDKPSNGNETGTALSASVTVTEHMKQTNENTSIIFDF